MAIGPLTNVALAFSADEDLPSLIRDIFIMGGNIESVGNCTEEGFSACAEFNFGADPEAAYVVLDRADMVRCWTTGFDTGNGIIVNALY